MIHYTKLIFSNTHLNGNGVGEPRLPSHESMKYIIKTIRDYEDHLHSKSGFLWQQNHKISDKLKFSLGHTFKFIGCGEF